MQAIANAHVAEKAVLRKECNILQKENKELRDDLEETQAMVEILKAQSQWDARVGESGCSCERHGLAKITTYLHI